MRSLLAALAASVVITPFAAWAIYKPTRVLLPEFGPVSCVSDILCTDDLARLEEMEALYGQGLRRVQERLGRLDEQPRGIFCTLRPCSKFFGNAAPAAFNVGTVGFVINPNGLTNYFVAHEMIHHIQNDRIGSARAMLKPAWWREGMAYSMSGDPRRPIPGDGTLEGYRVRFEAWLEQVGEDRLWEASDRL